jgi:hypothetical protein
MDGMIVQDGLTQVWSQDTAYTASGTINLRSPTATIAEISVSGFQWLYGSDMVAAGAFTGCVTDGSNPGTSCGGKLFERSSLAISCDSQWIREHQF